MWWKILLYVIPGLAAIIAVALVYGSSRWQSATKKIHAKLVEAHLPIKTTSYDVKELNDLPAPVRRYFRSVLKDGQPIISVVGLEQIGTFNMSETDDQWKPFTATQKVITNRPGFDWEAQIKMAPLVAVSVHDAYVAGEGILNASLFGLVTVAYLRGKVEVAQGELMRYFAEAAWYPTALLPSQGVYWEAVDDHSAKATLKDDENIVTILLRFNKQNLIESVSAERPRMVGGKIIPTQWEGRWSNYEIRDGMRIPLEGEVAWILPEGRKTYWRGSITNLSYEFAQ
jgi:hypothetical protein